MNITKDSGILVIPNDYPKQYTIRWYINVPNGSQMNLQFWSFDVGKNSSKSNPSYAAVRIYYLLLIKKLCSLYQSGGSRPLLMKSEIFSLKCQNFSGFLKNNLTNSSEFENF